MHREEADSSRVSWLEAQVMLNLWASSRGSPTRMQLPNACNYHTQTHARRSRLQARCCEPLAAITDCRSSGAKGETTAQETKSIARTQAHPVLIASKPKSSQTLRATLSNVPFRPPARVDLHFVRPQPQVLKAEPGDTGLFMLRKRMLQKMPGSKHLSRSPRKKNSPSH